MIQELQGNINKFISSTPSPDAWTFIKPGGIIQAIGVFAFAFMCHHNTFMLYSSMKNTSEEKWGTVTHISVGTSLIVSLVFSLVGYATFTGFVQGTHENFAFTAFTQQHLSQ